jgi:hypothetical protein
MMKKLGSLVAAVLLVIQFTGCITKDEAEMVSGDYLVIATRGNPRGDCQTVHKTSTYPVTRMVVYGPATYDDCEHWRMTHCARP